MSVRIIQGDARATGLPDRSVHCIATSPPYWGLRSYLKKDDPAKASEIGAEPTPEAYVESMREVGRECYRVLRDDGVMWINLGDTYAHPNASGPQGTNGDRSTRTFTAEGAQGYRGLPPGNIVGIPWRVAFALQADGWILRAAIPWVKFGTCMPESVKNRPTVAHEYVFLFAKAKGYFYDADAVRLPLSQVSIEQRAYFEAHGVRDGRTKLAPERGDDDAAVGGRGSGARGSGINPSGRNLRTSDFMNAALDEYEAHVKRVRAEGGLLLSPEGGPLTLLVNPVANKLSHFAMWPPKLVAPMILAGTSERGCCPTCGAQWMRRVEKTKGDAEAKDRPKHLQSAKSTLSLSGNGSEEWLHRGSNTRDLGFYPACPCPLVEPIPSMVYDPFGGTGTTAQVARALGRSAVLCELNEDYHPLIAKRLEEKLNPADWKSVKRAEQPRKTRERHDGRAAPIVVTQAPTQRRQRELFT